ncbi:MAG TPA: reverse transcriptase domain-containing protein [Steroidobacteraceae bacterium]|nr:reverse transcriptase domain-containing protein [Steroidobacteraceae bacterium]
MAHFLGDGTRPLGIPTTRDRAMQTLHLHLLTLEPISESTAAGNSYGFRPFRSRADAIVQCRNVLDRKHSSKWVLEGDIKGFKSRKAKMHLVRYADDFLVTGSSRELLEQVKAMIEELQLSIGIICEQTHDCVVTAAGRVRHYHPPASSRATRPRPTRGGLRIRGSSPTVSQRFARCVAIVTLRAASATVRHKLVVAGFGHCMMSTLSASKTNGVRHASFNYVQTSRPHCDRNLRLSWPERLRRCRRRSQC